MDRVLKITTVGRARGRSLLGALAAALAASTSGALAEPYAGPLFDAHLHYNDDAVVRYPPDRAFELLEKNGVKAILANSRPNDGTRLMHEAASRGASRGTRVVAFVRVYRTRADMATWFRDPEIHRMIVEEEKRGIYQGVGEFHVHGEDADTPVVKSIVDFAVSKDLVLHAHSDERAIEILFRHDPRARVIWAHTGFSTPPARVAEMLERYPTLYGELSYRSGITNGGGKLSDEWRRMFSRYPTRFLLGSDTWTLSRWDGYGAIVSEYRQWLGQLPPEIAERLAWRNAEELLGRR